MINAVLLVLAFVPVAAYAIARGLGVASEGATLIALILVCQIMFYALRRETD